MDGEDEYESVSYHSGAVSHVSSHSGLSGASLAHSVEWGAEEPIYREEEFRDSIRTLQGKRKIDLLEPTVLCYYYCHYYTHGCTYWSETLWFSKKKSELARVVRGIDGCNVLIWLKLNAYSD